MSGKPVVLPVIQAPEPSAPTAPERKRNPSWFKKGEPGPRLAHGLYTDDHPAAAAILAEVDRFTTAARIDEGDQEDLPARRASLIDYRGRIIHKNILKVALALEERGLFDKRGKLRVAWLSKVESLINTAVRIDNLLSLQRQAKTVSLADFLSVQQASNHQERHDHAEPEPNRTISGDTRGDTDRTDAGAVD